MSDWSGLEISLQNNGTLNVVVEDDRETNNPAINSASGSFQLNNIVNIFDGAYHNIVTCWSLGSNSIPNTAGSLSALQKIMSFIDSFNILNQSTVWAGKVTPLNFIYEAGNKPTYISIGAHLYDNSSTSVASSTNVTNVFNGIISDIAIWDTVLSSSNSNLVSNGAQLRTNDPLWWANRLGNDVTADPLTGNLKSYSGNLVAYYKLAQATGNVATDNAGITNGGAQINPAGGNPLTVWGAGFANNGYSITDTFFVNTDINVGNFGYLQFDDETGTKRRIGTIDYDQGIVVIDNEYNNSSSGLPLLSTLAISGLTFNPSSSGNNFYINYITFNSLESIERLSINAQAIGQEFNLTENPTGTDPFSHQQLLTDPATYISAVGLYNDNNELIAIGKLSSPVRKDADHDLRAQVRLDF